MNAKKLVPLCLLLVITLALPGLAPDVQAATTATGSWSVNTYSGYNQTRTFQYPETINATIAPVNISVSGQRVVSISDAANTSHTYFSTSIGFYPAGTNFTTGRVNISWALPAALQNGGIIELAVGLAGVKVPETFVMLTIQQNFTQAVLQIIAPFISGFQAQLNLQQGLLNQEKLARADDNFHNQQIEAVMGIAIVCLIVYIVHDKRQRSGRHEEIQQAASEWDQVQIGMAIENAESGEKARVEGAANGGVREQSKEG